MATSSASISIANPRSPRRWHPVGERLRRSSRGAPTPASASAARWTWSVDGVSGPVTTSSASTMGVVGLCHFLARVWANYPRQKVILIWDNWPVHRHPVVFATAAQLRIQIRWLPTYAPGTNPLEKLWRQRKQTVLHHHRPAEHFDELKAAAQAFLDQFAIGSTTGSLDLVRYVGLLPVPVT